MNRGQLSMPAGQAPTTTRTRNASRRRSLASLIMATLLLGACSNLITGDSLKDKVQEAVGEANADPVTVTIKASPTAGGALSLSGVQDKKVGVPFPLTATAYDAYTFAGWTYSSASGVGAVSFSSADQPITNATVTTKASDIIITANFTARLAVDSTSPAAQSTVVKNQPIVVAFTKAVDPTSLTEAGSIVVTSAPISTTNYTTLFDSGSAASSAYFHMTTSAMGFTLSPLSTSPASGNYMPSNNKITVTIAPTIRDNTAAKNTMADGTKWYFYTNTSVDISAPNIDSYYLRNGNSNTAALARAFVGAPSAGAWAIKSDYINIHTETSTATASVTVQGIRILETGYSGGVLQSNVETLDGWDSDYTYALKTTDPGEKTLVMSVVSSTGTDSTTETFKVYLDKTAPVVSGFTLASGATYTKNQTVPVSISATDDTGMIYGYQVSESATAGATWVTSAPTTYTLASAANGLKTVYAYSMDMAGNVSDYLVQTIVLDTIAPTAILSGPYTTATGTDVALTAAKSGISAFYKVVFSDGTVNLNTGTVGTYVTVNTTGAPAPTHGALVVTGAGLTRYIEVPTLANNGTMGVTINLGAASDAAGNNSAVAGPSVTYTVDNTPPTATLSGPFTTGTGTDVALIAAKSGTSAFYKVVFSDGTVNLSTGTTGTYVTVNTTGAPAPTYGALVVTGAGLTRYIEVPTLANNGTIGVTINLGAASDALGNNSAVAGPSATYTVDNAPPTATLTGPFTTGTGTDVALTAAKSGTSAFYKVVFSDGTVNLSTGTVGTYVTVNTTGAPAPTYGALVVTGAGLTKYIEVPTLANNGTIGVTINTGAASDTAGNTSAVAGPSTTYTVDNVAPTATLTGPFTTGTGTDVGLTEAKSGISAFYKVVFSDGTVNLSTGTVGTYVTVNTTGAPAPTHGALVVTGAGLTRYIEVPTLANNGTMGVTINLGAASDAAGNNSAVAGPSVTYTVDNTPPTATLTGPFTTGTGTDVALSEARSGTSAFYKVVFSDGTVNLSTGTVGTYVTVNTTGAPAPTYGALVVTGAGLTKYIEVPTLANNGTIGVAINLGAASDALGNNSAVAGPSATYTVDNAPPTATLTGPFTTGTGTDVALTAAKSGTSAFYKVVFSDGTVNLSTGTAGTYVTVNTTGAPAPTYGALVVTGPGLTKYIEVPTLANNGTIGITINLGAAADALGNNSAVAGPSATYIVDNAVPTINTGTAAATKGTPPTLQITASDSGSGPSTIMYSTNSGGTYYPVSYSTDASLASISNGAFVFYVVDAAGNESLVYSFTYSNPNYTFVATPVAKSLGSAGAGTKARYDLSSAKASDPYGAFSSFYGKSAQATSVEVTRALAQNASVSRTSAAARLPSKPASITAPAPAAAAVPAQPASPAQAVVYRTESGANRSAPPAELAKTDKEPSPATAAQKPTQETKATVVSFSAPAQPAGGSSGQKAPSPQPQDGQGRMPAALLAPSTWREEEAGSEEA